MGAEGQYPKSITEYFNVLPPVGFLPCRRPFLFSPINFPLFHGYTTEGILIHGIQTALFCPVVGEGRNKTMFDENNKTGYAEISVPQEQLRREVDYVRAQRVLKSMLDKGLISLSEFDKITTLNRESFSPMLAGIMPSNRCYNSHSELI
jgi:hypothetical protein